jgi:hypothetical protein
MHLAILSCDERAMRVSNDHRAELIQQSAAHYAGAGRFGI